MKRLLLGLIIVTAALCTLSSCRQAHAAMRRVVFDLESCPTAVYVVEESLDAGATWVRLTRPLPLVFDTLQRADV